jgi:AsmA family/AsmA-like C-terminal region
MSIWKSPVFYLGLILIGLVVAALAAPFIVNWNSYRDNLEAYGHRLTGRDVAINGQISVRLFPWPRLSAEDVSVGNPVGFTGPPLLNARNLTAELALAAFFSGEIRVEAIYVDHPVINFARLADGRGNWVFKPDATISSSRLLEQVKLDQINVVDGVLHLEDKAHGFSNTLTAVNAAVSAAALEGPWRLRATANQNETPIEVTFSSAEWKTGEAFRFGGKLVPQDGSLPTFAFDGATQDGIFKGKIRLEPVVSEDGRSSLDRHFKPLQMQADIEGSFERVALNKIHIVPADLKDSGTLIEGSASVALTDGVKAEVNLNSPRIDLDGLTGAQSQGFGKVDGLMVLLNKVMKEFPQQFDLAGNFNIASLSMAGESLENVVLRTSAEPNAIRVQNLTANLPGRSRMKFNGLVFPGDKAAELGGSLAFESNDTRAFASWLWPQEKAELAKMWTGNRGRLKAETDVSWSDKNFGFQNVKYELDGAAGNCELIVGIGDFPAFNLHLNAPVFEMDNYISDRTSYTTEILPLLQNSSGIEKHLDIQVGKLRLNGVEAQDLGIDYVSSARGFEIKKLNIGSIEGGKVEGQGLITQGPDGPAGEIKVLMHADNPRGFLHLLGVTPKESEPQWTSVLGQTDMQAVVTVKPGEVEPFVTYDVSGKSGALQVSASGDVKDITKAYDAKLGFSAEVTSAHGDDIVRIFGLNPFSKSDGAGKLNLTASGSASSGFKTALSVEALGANFGYQGQFKPDASLPFLNGAVSAKADDGKTIGQALGLPSESLLAGPLKFDSPVVTQDGQIRLTKIIARVAGQDIAGDLTVTGAGEVGADLAMKSADLKALLTVAFMEWRGKAPQLDDAFAAPRDFPKSVYVWVRPEFLLAGFGSQLKESVIGISIDQEGRSLTIASTGNELGPFKLDLSVKPHDAKFTLAGSLQMAVELEPNVKLQNGTAIAQGKVVLEGTFSGEGRSPAAVFSDLNGNGTMSLQNVKMTQVAPQNFFAQLAAIKDAVALQKAFDVLLQGPGFEVPAVSQPFSVSAGIGNIQPIVIDSKDAELRVTPSFDLSNGTVATEITITPKENADLPPMRIRYSGYPQSLVQRNDTSAIAAKLGYAMIAKDMAELDRIQTEQAKIVANEEAQRRADEEKFAAFQAQRAELRLRQRELKVFAAQRVTDASNDKIKLEKILSDAAALNKIEMPKFLRLLH